MLHSEQNGNYIYQLLDSTGISSEGNFLYKDFKLTYRPSDSPGDSWEADTVAIDSNSLTLNVATYIDNMYPGAAIVRLLASPPLLKFNMDLYYDALEYPPDNDTMFE
jgi:hypothetical protein